jgi:hypothetical protein
MIRLPLHPSPASETSAFNKTAPSKAAQPGSCLADQGFELTPLLSAQVHNIRKRWLDRTYRGVVLGR